MLSIQIDNPIVENYFHDTDTIKKVLEFIAINKIDIDSQIDLTDRVKIGLEEISLLVSGVKEEKRARDFLDEL